MDEHKQQLSRAIEKALKSFFHNIHFLEHIKLVDIQKI